MNPIETYYALKFLRLLTLQWKDTEAFKLGLLDDSGKLLKPRSEMNDEEKQAYSVFKRLVFNIKRLMQKVPGAHSKIGRYATALALIREHMEEDAPTNNISGNNIAMPEVPAGKIRREKFGDVDVFIVDGATYHKSVGGKKKYARWANYVDIEEDLGSEIRSFANKNPKKPIIVKHEDLGSMCYVRR